MSWEGPVISHLLFADDNILFEKASLGVTRVLKDVLWEYKVNFNYCVNFNKSSIFFSANVSEIRRCDLASNLGVKYSNNPERYLGLRNMVRRKKKLFFMGLKERM